MKFETINNTLCRMVEPEPLTTDAKFPCVVRLIQDDSQMGRYNQSYSEYRYGVRLGCCMLPIIATHIAKNGIVNDIEWDVSRYEIIGYPVADGSAEWGEYQTRQGKTVIHEYGCVVRPEYDGSSRASIFEYYSTGWQIYKKPEPKPLLADAKEGWLVTNREGHTSTIKYVDNNKGVLKYAYEVSDGTTIYVRENGMFNIINHNSNYDIIATEPLAEEGTAEWALQMMRLGKWVVHEKAYPCHIHCNMVTWSNDETPPLFTMQIPSKWLSDNLLYSGWQLYEPKPQPQYKAGDWVEIEVSGVISQHRVKYGVFVDSINAGGFEFYGNGLPVMKPLNARIIRKLDPSEVKVTLTLEGTVRLNGEDCEHFLLKHSPGRASTTRFDALDPATCTLVKNLLKEKK